MNKAHATIIALALGVAAVAGTFAALETTSLGAQAASGSGGEGQLAARKAKLDRAERKLDRAANRRPPALPAIPAAASSSGSSFSAGSSGPNPGPGGPVLLSDDSGHDEFDDHGHDDDEFDDDDHHDDERDDD